MRYRMKISSMKYNLRRKKVHQDENPLEMMANLMDVMLVFACGLMLALIVNWNVDLGGQEVDYVSEQEITETQLNENKSESEIDENQDYKKMGTVYQDPETGRMYMVTTGNETKFFRFLCGPPE